MSPSASEALANTLATPLSPAGPVVENLRIEKSAKMRGVDLIFVDSNFYQMPYPSLSTHGYSIIRIYVLESP